jgi:hypothetical protein
LNILQNLINEDMKNTKQNHYLFLKREIEDLNICLNKSEKKNNFLQPANENCGFHENEEIKDVEKIISRYLRTSNLYYSVKEKLYFKMKQIKSDEYNWLSKGVLKKCFQRMNQVMFDEVCDEKRRRVFKGQVEHTFISSIDEMNHKKIDDFLKDYFPNMIFRFTARADLITEKSVWEIKCVNSITHEHLLQLAIYCWLWRMSIEDMENLENVKSFKIFNIKTGEHYVLDATMEELDEIILTVLCGKYTDLMYENDEEFVEKCQKCVILRSETK